MYAQRDNNYNSWRVNEIRQKDYADFRQLMDITLKSISSNKQEKSVEMLEDCNESLITFSSEYSDCCTSCNDSIGQLPFEIKFNDDDDFEQVLPLSNKGVSWNIPTKTESTSMSSKEQSSQHASSEFEFMSNTSYPPRSYFTFSFKTKRKVGLWKRVKKVLGQLMTCGRKQQRPQEGYKKSVNIPAQNSLNKEYTLEGTRSEDLNKSSQNTAGKLASLLRSVVITYF